MKKTYLKISQIVENIFDMIGNIGLLITVGCSAYNIISLWITGRRVPYLDEFSLIALVWVVYIGMGLLYKNNEHVTMDFLIKLLPNKGKAISRIFNDILIIITSAATTYYAWHLSIKSFDKLMMITKIPYFFCDIAVVIGFAHLAILSLVDIFVNISALIHKKEVPANIWKN